MRSRRCLASVLFFAAATTTVILASPAVGARALPVQPPDPGLAPTDAWDTFTADVTIRRHLESMSGEARAEAPPVRYRWTRTQRAGGWRSTVDILDVAPPRIATARGRLLTAAATTAITTIVRIEDDEDGSTPRVYNRHGEPIRVPSTEDRRILGEPVAGSLAVPQLPEIAAPERADRRAAGREWVDGFVAAPARAAARRASLPVRYGRAAGRVGRLDRFVAVRGGQVVEVLADAGTGLPVEVNVADADGLAGRSTVAYAAGTGGTLIRRTVRTDHLVRPRGTDRAVATIDLTNVRLERRGRR